MLTASRLSRAARGDRELKQASGPPSANRVLWATSVGHVVTHWYPATFYLVLPFVGKELGLSYTQMGLLITLRFIMTALASIPAGMLVDLGGRRVQLMVLSLTMVGAAYFLLGVSGHYGLLLVGVAALGVGNNIWHPPAISLLKLAYPAQSGWANGVHATAANVGDAIAPVAAGLLLLVWPWRAVLLVNIVPGLAMALFIWILLKRAAVSGEVTRAVLVPDASPSRPGFDLRSYLHLLKQVLLVREVMLLGATAGVRALAQNTVATFLPLYLINNLGLSSFTAGGYIAWLQIIGGISGPFYGSLSDRKGRRGLVFLGLLGAGASLIAMGQLSGRPFLAPVVVAGLGFFLYAIRPVMYAWTMEVTPPQYGGTAVGFLLGVQYLLSSLAVAGGGWLADRWGLAALFPWMAGLVLAAGGLVLLVKENRPCPDDGA